MKISEIDGGGQCAAEDGRRVWTGRALEILMTVYPRQGARAVATQSGMTLKQVKGQVTYLGLRREWPKGHVMASKRVKIITKEPMYGMTDREIDVVRAVAGGQGTKGAARDIGLTPSTVSEYLKRIYIKMDVHCKVGCVLKAERAGMLSGVRP